MNPRSPHQEAPIIFGENQVLFFSEKVCFQNKGLDFKGGMVKLAHVQVHFQISSAYATEINLA